MEVGPPVSNIVRTVITWILILSPDSTKSGSWKTLKDLTWNLARIFMYRVMSWRCFANIAKGLLWTKTIPVLALPLSCWNSAEVLKASQQEMPSTKIYTHPCEWRNLAKYILYMPLHIPSVSLPKGSYVTYLKEALTPTQTQSPLSLTCSLLLVRNPLFFLTSFYVSSSF